MTTSRKPQLLPFPRHLNLLAGKFQLPKNPVLHLPADLPLELALLPLSERLQGPLRNLGVNLELTPEQVATRIIGHLRLRG